MTANDALLIEPVIPDKNTFLLATAKALANVLRQEGWFFPRDTVITYEFLQKITKAYLVFISHFDDVDEVNFEKESLLKYIRNLEMAVKMMEIQDQEVYDKFLKEILLIIIK